MVVLARAAQLAREEEAERTARQAALLLEVIWHFRGSMLEEVGLEDQLLALLGL